MMKKIISLLLALTFIFALTGCKKSDDRLLFNVNLKKYIAVSDYKGIKIDTESEEFKEYEEDVISQDVSGSDLYVKVTEGVLKDGDVANIDYEGKLNGVAFEGGTDKGYNLTLGSGTFISGFEEGLIGKKIGDTVDLDLTFPDSYGTEELAGKDVVFTVKINYVLTDEERKPEDFYKELDYKTVEEYYANVEKLAIKQYISSKIVEMVEVKSYPKKDKEFILEQRIKFMENNVKNYYGITLEEYCTSTGTTLEKLKEETITNYIEPMMKELMAYYLICEEEKLNVTDEDIEEKTKEIVAQYDNESVTEKEIKDYYGEYYFEYITISERVMDYLIENAKVS